MSAFRERLPKPLRNVIKWCGKKLRYYRKSKMERRNTQYDEQTGKVLQLTPGNYVDVGCHTGAILREMLNVSPTGKHMAFEPLPHLAELLRKQFPEVDVHQVALSDTAGETSFQFARKFAGRSGMKVIDYPGETDVETITVEKNTLDALIDHPIDVIKIDVEGAELEVLNGAKGTLRSQKPLVIFEHGAAARHYGTTSNDIYDLFADCGLDVYLISDWLRSKKELTRERFHKESTTRHWYFIAAASKRADGTAT